MYHFLMKSFNFLSIFNQMQNYTYQLKFFNYRCMVDFMDALICFKYRQNQKIQIKFL